MATCYARVGQHSSYSHGWYVKTRAAKPEEYAALLRELEQIGYDDLVVYSRHQRWMHAMLRLNEAR
jgi:hypothetical protein